jgi:uncharacterized protein
MKFTQHRQEGINLIRRYGADYIVVGEQEIRSSCIVGMNTLVSWPPRSVEELGVEHLGVLFGMSPEVVVLSTGATQKFPRAALRAEFATRKIGIEVMEIGAAARTYNVLLGEERRVLAAVLLPGPAKQSE